MPGDRRRQHLRVLEAQDVSAAIDLAKELQRAGEYDLFRGQTEQWPIVASIMRLDEDGQRSAHEKLQRFLYWASSTAAVRSMVGGDEPLAALLGIAQHYGLPTTLVDFTRDPEIAGFFASDGAPNANGAACIYCLSRNFVISQVDAFARYQLANGVGPEELQIPVLIDIDVANLWRLQAQAGVFLHVPFDREELDDGWLEQLIGMACIVFPVSGPADDPRRNRVYPSRKSQLEVLLDEFFSREQLRETRAMFEAEGWTIIDADTPMLPVPAGLKPEIQAVMELVYQKRHLEIFINDTPPDPHESWSDDGLKAWQRPPAVRFGDTPDLAIELSFSRSDDMNALDRHCIDQFLACFAANRNARSHVVRWSLLDRKTRKPLKLSPQTVRALELTRTTVAEWIDFAWDGMRSLPFTDEEIAICLGRSVAAFMWDAKRGRSIGDFFNEFYGDKLIVELITDTKGDPVSALTSSGLQRSLRPDLKNHLKPEWQHLADDMWLMLRVFGSPFHATEFSAWRRLFVGEVLPMQISLAAEINRDWLVFNPADVRRIQPH